MKKLSLLAALFAVAFQASAFAAVVEGVVASVKAEENALVVTTAEGEASVKYNAETSWPEGVTDPAALVGKTVKATTNDETQVATMVETPAEAAVAAVEAVVEAVPAVEAPVQQ